MSRPAFRSISVVLALALGSFASSPAWTQDGVYSGQIQCAASGMQRVTVGTIRINVAGAGFTYEVQLAGGGVERGSGSVTPPSVAGGGSASGGASRYDSSYSGQIMQGGIWMTGDQRGTFPGGASGDRQCSISTRRG